MRARRQNVRRAAARSARQGPLPEARRQQSVAELGKLAIQGAAFDTLLNDAARVVADGLDVELVQVLERREGSLVPRAGVGWEAGARGPAPLRQAPRTHAGLVVLAGAPVSFEDAEREAPSTTSYLTGHGIKGGVGVPIVGGQPELPFGVLAAYSRSVRSFAAEDVAFLQIVANVLAGAALRRREEAVRHRLFVRMMSAQEEERRRIALELHDETGQVLASLLVGLRMIEDTSTISLSQARASQLAKITASSIDAVSRLSRGLHPLVLRDLGLVPALQRHAEDHAAVLGVEIVVEDALGGHRMPKEAETALFRIAQEAIANVGKHAGAKRVSVTVARTRRGIELTVQDDGRGFDVERTLSDAIGAGRLGLQGMRERAVFLGGDAEVVSHPRRGTRIRVRIPLPVGGTQDEARA